MADIKVTPVVIAVSAAQYTAIRQLSLKYENMSVQAYAERLFAQVVRNYFKTSLKAAAAKAAADWDRSNELGFDTKISRDEYVGRAVKSAKDTWKALNAGNNSEIE